LTRSTLFTERLASAWRALTNWFQMAVVISSS
jgi:hypothetical protein